MVRQDAVIARQYLDRALELAQKIGSLRNIVDAHVTLGWLAFHSGDFVTARDHVQLCLDNNQDFYYDWVRWMPQLILAFVKIVDEEKYEEGLRLAQEVYNNVTYYQHIGTARGAIASSLIGLERYQAAIPYICKELEAFTGALQFGGVIRFALILGKLDRYEDAAQLLGFCDNDSAGAWYKKWSVTHDVIRKARVTLGEEAFQAAFETGQALDLETVVQELLDEFEPED